MIQKCDDVNKKIEMMRIKMKFLSKLSDQIDETSNIQKYSTADQEIQRKKKGKKEKKEKAGGKKERKKRRGEIYVYILSLGTKSRNKRINKQINK